MRLHLTETASAEQGTTPPTQPGPALRYEDDDTIDIGALFGTLWRGKWLIAIIAAICVFAGGYYAFFMTTNLYKATSVIILETEQKNVVDLESVVGGFSGDTSSINSEIQVLKSRSLMGKVVDRMDLTKDPEFNGSLRPPSQQAQLKAWVRQLILGPPPKSEPLPPEVLAERRRDGAINALISRVSVTNIRSSLVLQITATTEGARKSAEIADTLAELYVLNQLEVKFEATQQATEWLSEQVADLQVQLEAAEARLADFSSETDLISVEVLQALERQLKDQRDRLAAAEQTAETQGKQLEILLAAESAEEKVELTDDLQLRRFLPRIEEASIATAFDNRFQQIVGRIQLEATRAQQQIPPLRASEEELESRIETQSADLIRLQQLQREAEATRALYESFLSRLKETSVQQGIQQADSRVLSNAVVPGIATQPRRSRIIALAGVLGIMLGSALVLLREMRNTAFRTARELEAYTGVNVIGQIPTIPVRVRKRTLQYLADKPTSAAAEAVRNLRTSVFLSNVDNPPKVILSTSALPGEGKTTNSLALAHNLMGMGKSVLLIEGDIRRRTFSQYFPNMPKKGLVSVLMGQMELEEAIFKAPGYGADMLVGEKTATNAADLFASDKFKDLVADLREKYDAIVIDTPPVLVVPDARIIAQVADAVLFTVKWDSTSKTQVEEGLNLFRQSNQKVTGLVLSQISPRGMKRYGYGGKYGAYSSYGSKYYVN